jgi:DNA-binding transcriptional LysR family regulator
VRDSSPSTTCAPIRTFPPARRRFARGPLDGALEQIGRSRHAALVVPSYALGALMVLEGDVICLLPRMMATHLGERGVPLKFHEVPFDLPTVDVELRWHRRLDNDPASQWLRRCVHDAVRPLIATPGE